MRGKIVLDGTLIGLVACLIPFVRERAPDDGSTADPLASGKDPFAPSVSDASPASRVPPKLSDRSGMSLRQLIRSDLKKIMIPVVEFDQADPGECIEFVLLRVNHESNDVTDGRRYNFSIRKPLVATPQELDAKPPKTITISRGPTDAWTLLNQLADEGGFDFRIGEQGVLEFSPDSSR